MNNQATKGMLPQGSILFAYPNTADFERSLRRFFCPNPGRRRSRNVLYERKSRAFEMLMQGNVPRSVCHSFTVLSVSNKGLGLSQQAMHRQGHFRECGYTPYACCGISFLTTTTVNTLHFSKPIRKSSKTIHAGFLKNCGYSYIMYLV